MRPSPLRRVVYTLLALIVGLVALEIGARGAIWVGVHAMLPKDVRDWVTTHDVVFDPELGWRPASRPLAITGANFHGESTVRDGEAKRPGELRGYAFGDSQTHGAGIAEDNAWPLVTERVLREAGHDVTVINLGSSGYRSAQVLRLIETYVLPRGADFLIVDCQANDGQALKRSVPGLNRTIREVLFESRLYRLLWLGVGAVRGEHLGAADGAVRIEQPQGGPGPGNHPEIMALAAREGIPLLFVDYPFIGEPIVQLAPPSRLPPGANVVLASEALRATGRPAQALFLENNHLTVEGSEVVGKAVADALAAELGLGAAAGK